MFDSFIDLFRGGPAVSLMAKLGSRPAASFGRGSLGIDRLRAGGGLGMMLGQGQLTFESRVFGFNIFDTLSLPLNNP